MKIEEALFAYLTGYAGLVALVADRVYPTKLPPSPVLPAVVYQRISSTRTYSHDDAPGTPDWVTVRMQFSCWADGDSGYDVATDVGAQVVAALSGYRGTMGSVRVGAALVELDDDDFEPDTARWRRRVDVMISHEEG